MQNFAIKGTGPFEVTTLIKDEKIRYNYFNDIEDAKLYINMVLDWYPRPEGVNFTISDVIGNVLFTANDKVETKSELEYEDVLPIEMIGTHRFHRTSQYKFTLDRENYKPYVNF